MQVVRKWRDETRKAARSSAKTSLAKATKAGRAEELKVKATRGHDELLALEKPVKATTIDNGIKKDVNTKDDDLKVLGEMTDTAVQAPSDQTLQAAHVNLVDDDTVVTHEFSG
jgi:hypothetical protein